MSTRYRSRLRRRRHKYTPAQEQSRQNLHRAEMWLHIVSNGIAKALEREAYCTEGTRSIIDLANTELAAACQSLEAANGAHDKLFERSQLRMSKVIPAPAKPRKKKDKPK